MKKLMIILFLFLGAFLNSIYVEVTEEVLGVEPSILQAPEGLGVSFADINNDGYADLFLSRDFCFLNNGDGTFSARDNSDIIPYIFWNGLHRSAFADADGDDDIDMIMSGHYPSGVNGLDCEIYYLENQGSPNYEFTVEVIYSTPINTRGGQPTFIDGDADGDYEVYLGMFGNWAPSYGVGFDQYFQMDNANIWQNETLECFPELSLNINRRPTRGTNACDYDNDNDMDIFVPVYGLNTADPSWENLLWQNEGTGYFTDFATEADVAIEPHGRYGIGLASGASWGDFDNDGFFDLVCGNIHGWAAVYRNNRDGTFTNVTEEVGVITTGQEQQWHNTNWVDHDNDGDLDLLLTQWYDGYRYYIYENEGPENLGYFTDVATELGFNPNQGFTSVDAIGAADFDHDGDMDLMFTSRTAGNEGGYFYRNDLSEQDQENNWLTINLIGNGSTTGLSAIGSKVILIYDDFTMSHVMQVESSSADQTMNEQVVHFGLGNKEGIALMQVQWTDGTTEYWSDISELNERISIVQGTGNTEQKIQFVDAAYIGNENGSIGKPFTTIQQAIDHAVPNSLILVNPGLYSENIVMNNVSLNIANVSTQLECIISSADQESVVSISNSDILLKGISITEGTSTIGAGIHCSTSNIILDEVIVYGNSSENGSALLAVDSDVLIDRSHIKMNTTSNGSVISLDNSNTEIFNTVIHNNTSSSGNIIHSESSDININFSTIASNIIEDDFSVLLTLNSVGNQIINSIFYNECDLQITDLEENTVVEYCLIKGGWNGVGIIDANPIFVDMQEQNYRLSNFSPCIGLAEAEPILPFDNDGNVRPDPEGSIPDIGAYENDRVSPALSMIHVSNDGSNVTGDGSITNPFETIQFGITSAHGQDTVFVHSGIYTENITIESKQITLISNYYFSTLLEDIENTIIDGDQIGSVITLIDESEETKISGFTIKNGSIAAGGGINIDNSNLELSDLIIRDNFASSNGGGMFLYSSSPTISNVLLFDNNANANGGAIYCQNSNPVFDHLTVTNNSAEYNGDSFGFFTSNIEMNNSIVWNNFENNIFEISSTINFTYSNIQNGWAGTGNIDTDPLFSDPENDDFSLAQDSPCIDAGDPNSPLDPDGTITDMGILFYNNISSIEEDIIPSGSNRIHLSNFPNPFNPSTTISFNLSTEITENTELIIYNLKGQKVIDLSNSLCHAEPVEARGESNYSVIWNGRDFSGKSVSSGVYFYKLKINEKFSFTKKMLLMK